MMISSSAMTSSRNVTRRLKNRVLLCGASHGIPAGSNSLSILPRNGVGCSRNARKSAGLRITGGVNEEKNHYSLCHPMGRTCCPFIVLNPYASTAPFKKSLKMTHPHSGQKACRKSILNLPARNTQMSFKINRRGAL